MRSSSLTSFSASPRGRVYRRCGFRDTNGRQLGQRCPAMVRDPQHGTWTFAVDAHTGDGRRRTVRRGGFPTQAEAALALRRWCEADTAGGCADPNQTLADHLTTWLPAKARHLKPTTLARYRDHVLKDLIPALGHLRLDQLTRHHIRTYAHQQLAAGRGRVAVYRILATLSSALGDAVRDHRLTHNPAQPALLPRPVTAERPIWSTHQAALFLRHCRRIDPLLHDLCTLMIATGLRRGEALALHWEDIDLRGHRLFVRHTLAAIDNNQLQLTGPKTPASKDWVPLSPHALNTLRRRAAPSARTGLVFHRPDGGPLHPQRILDHFHRRSLEAGVPRIHLHDLRHLTATLMLTSGVPLTITSKTLRHSTLSTTANVYGHLTPAAARHATGDAEKALRPRHRPLPRRIHIRTRSRRDHHR
ncbi:tyrosine-type recombinase/integrase [Streptomyces sp. NPDC054866]